MVNELTMAKGGGLKDGGRASRQRTRLVQITQQVAHLGTRRFQFPRTIDQHGVIKGSLDFRPVLEKVLSDEVLVESGGLLAVRRVTGFQKPV